SELCLVTKVVTRNRKTAVRVENQCCSCSMPIGSPQIFPIRLELPVVECILEPTPIRRVEQQHGPVQGEVVVQADDSGKCARKRTDPVYVGGNLGPQRMHAVHSLAQRSTDLFIGCGDGSRRRPQCPVNVLGIPAREQNMLEVGSPELGEYWGSGGEQSFCVSNAMECWVCELLVDGDTGAVAQKEGAPTFSTDV